MSLDSSLALSSDAAFGCVAQDCIAGGDTEQQQSPAGSRLHRLMASTRKFVRARVRAPSRQLPAEPK